jgi:hypothetical protein
MNMERSMLKEKKMSNEYSGEAVAYSVYILNLSPTSSLKNQVPQEAWSGMNLVFLILMFWFCGLCSCS